uniref:Uncharacterized protein n=1 Tax=Arundo donax TaxID=35708 RepID=A0A0A9FSW7_ARUDO
MVAKCTCIAI